MPDIIIHDMTIDDFADYDEGGVGYLIGTGRVDEVKHGHWSPNPHNRAWDVCSACGIGTKRREYGINPDGTEYVTEYSYRYCPNCGAKMDLNEVENG